MNEWTNEWLSNVQKIESNGRLKEWKNEWMNKWMNKQIAISF